jgi:hypothetical protein
MRIAASRSNELAQVPRRDLVRKQRRARQRVAGGRSRAARARLARRRRPCSRTCWARPPVAVRACLKAANSRRAAFSASRPPTRRESRCAARRHHTRARHARARPLPAGSAPELGRRARDALRAWAEPPRRSRLGRQHHPTRSPTWQASPRCGRNSRPRGGAARRRARRSRRRSYGIVTSSRDCGSRLRARAAIGRTAGPAVSFGDEAPAVV